MVDPESNYVGSDDGSDDDADDIPINEFKLYVDIQIIEFEAALIRLCVFSLVIFASFRTFHFPPQCTRYT